jgi:hypothetical protein
MPERPLPCAPEAEKLILGSLLAGMLTRRTCWR